MRIWLDDERDPNDPQIQFEFGAEPDMLWVKTASAAISQLKSRNVTFISLDHDLASSQTGYDVAKWIELKAYSGELPKLSWDCHSMNPVGRKRIIAALQSADRVWSSRK